MGDEFGKRHVAIFAALEIVIIVCFALFTEYGTEVGKTELGAPAENSVKAYYGKFQDVHVMIFIGFGFLMTFMKRYSFSAVGYNFILSVITIQYATLTNGFFDRLFSSEDDAWDHKIAIDNVTLITGDFAAGAVLISFGALLGKASLEQLLVMILGEMIFYGINEHIGAKKLEAMDMGGSMYVHTFGAYFGLAVSRVLTNGQKVEAAGAAGDKFGSRYTSDIFAMIGTVFLWMFWPSFNGALADGNAEHRVIVNTVLSLTASCFTAFLASKFFREGHRLDMVDIQNATLAGGVAIGTGADSMVGPAVALTVGAIAGILSVVGYVHISPVMEEKLKIHDTCGVHNLHGMPGVLGAVVGAIAAGSATASVYGDDQLSSVYGIGSGARSAGEQMGYQLLALVVTLSMAMVGGALTGCIMNLVPGSAEYGEDAKNWTIEDESAPLTLAETVSVSKCGAEVGATAQEGPVPEAEAISKVGGQFAEVDCTIPRGQVYGMEPMAESSNV